MRNSWRFLWVGFLVLVLGSVAVVGVGAQAVDEVAVMEKSVKDLEEAAATSGAMVATPAASLVQRITEKSSDLTETEGATKGRLEQLVLEELVGPFRVTNALRWSIRSAVMAGVPANTIVLLLMFPLVTAMIAASRHLVGLRGFGIFTPAIVAVGFLATGITVGLILFLVIMSVATAARVVIRKLRMPYLPRTSLMLWFVSMAMLVVLLLSPYLAMADVARLSIFPILLMILLAETFIEVQTRRSRSQAVEMTLETLLMAVISYFVMNLELVHTFVLLNPELVMGGVVIFNLFVGKFDGLRLLEYWRFREILK